MNGDLYTIEFYIKNGELYVLIDDYECKFMLLGQKHKDGFDIMDTIQDYFKKKYSSEYGKIMNKYSGSSYLALNRFILNHFYMFKNPVDIVLKDGKVIKVNFEEGKFKKYRSLFN